MIFRASRTYPTVYRPTTPGRGQNGTVAELALTARLNPSAADARRGVVRLHPEALTALGLREWDGIALIGSPM